MFGVGLGSAALAQQDPMFTKYMFNALAFNPAYAGSKNYLSTTAILRDQWLSWGKGNSSVNAGAPLTYAASVHSPAWERVGLGGYITQDRLGSSVFSEVKLAYAYRMALSADLTLSLGLQGGVTYFNHDYSGLNFKDPQVMDPSFRENRGAMVLPNAGAGLYLYSEKLYAGLSVPRLFETELRDVEELPQETASALTGARNYRHLYLAAGAAIPVGSRDLVFKPSLLVKGVGLLDGFSTSRQDVATVRTPTQFDVDLSLLIRQVLWVGGSFRSTFDYVFQSNSSHDSADLWAAFYLDNGLRLGLAYDYSLTRLQSYGSGSVEVMIGYDLNYSVKRFTTPRYF